MPPFPPVDSAHSEAQRFLYDRIDYERAAAVPYHSRAFGLNRMRNLLARLDDPHSQVRVVHVAGTKGKGSTAAMIAESLAAAGYRTGLYTSPHLERPEERIAVDGVPVAPETWVRLVHRLRPVVERLDREPSRDGQPGPTFFEITTAMAFQYFAEMSVDLAVLEVGMGGRLDSTNVCRPDVSVITSISLDHTRQLGDTLAKIALEKAGILKAGVPAVSGVRASEPLDVIERRAAEAGAPLFRLGREFELIERSDSVPRRGAIGALRYAERTESAPFELDGIELGMIGGHQARNAAVAIAALCRLRERGWSIPDTSIRQGLARAKAPARIECLSLEPLVIIDVAHNVASIDALVDCLDAHYPNRSRTFVVAVSQDKDVDGMLRRLVPACDRLIATRFRSNPRSADPDHLAAIARSVASHCGRTPRVEVSGDSLSAWRAALESSSDGSMICIAGSFFLAAELRSIARRETEPARLLVKPEAEVARGAAADDRGRG